jgi:hypothetical protein
LANSRVFDISSVASGDVGCHFVDTIKAEATFGQDRSLTETMAKPALGLAVVQGTVEGVSFYGILGGRWPRSSSGEAEFALRLRPASDEAEFTPEGETVLCRTHVPSRVV